MTQIYARSSFTGPLHQLDITTCDALLIRYTLHNPNVVVIIVAAGTLVTIVRHIRDAIS
jgi:hypothetical protein